MNPAEDAATPTFWFSVSFLLERQFRGDLKADVLYELRVVLVRATNEAEAAAKGARIGTERPEEYLNDAGEIVSWEFREVIDAKQLPDEVLAEGSEVWWDFLDQRGLDELGRTIGE